jgi:hypothetical protein
LQVSDEQWQLQVEVGGTGGRWSAKAAKKQVGQRRLQVTAVTVPGRDRKTIAKKGDDPGQMSSGRCKWRLEVQPVGTQSGGRAVAGGGRRCKWQLERRSGEEAGGAEPVAGISCDGARSG